MQQIQIIATFLLLWFISITNCQSATDCEKCCPINSVGSFEADKATGVHKNLSHCLIQNECYNIDDCSKILTQHYCHSGSCTVTCEVGESEASLSQTARVKRLFGGIHFHFHNHGSASRPAGMCTSFVVAATTCGVLLSLGNILL